MSFEQDKTLYTARHARLIEALHNLSHWCAKRAEGEHDDDTTMTILLNIPQKYTLYDQGISNFITENAASIALNPLFFNIFTMFCLPQGFIEWQYISMPTQSKGFISLTMNLAMSVPVFS